MSSAKNVNSNTQYIVCPGLYIILAQIEEYDLGSNSNPQDCT